MRVTPPHPASRMTSLCWKCQRRLTWTSTPRCVWLRQRTLTLSMAKVPGCMAGAQHPVGDPRQLHSLRCVSLYSQRMIKCIIQKKELKSLKCIIYQVSVPVVTPDQCAVTMGTREDGQICAGGEAGKDSCQVRILTFSNISPDNHMLG